MFLAFLPERSIYSSDLLTQTLSIMSLRNRESSSVGGGGRVLFHFEIEQSGKASLRRWHLIKELKKGRKQVMGLFRSGAFQVRKQLMPRPRGRQSPLRQRSRVKSGR